MMGVDWKMNKVSVSVRCSSSEDGILTPLEIVWKDGRVWKVERILHTCRSPDLSFEGTRYTILIGGVEKYLYHAGTEWYVYTPA